MNLAGNAKIVMARYVNPSCPTQTNGRPERLSAKLKQMTGRLTIVAHEAGAWANHRSRTVERATQCGWRVSLLMGGQGDPVPLGGNTAPVYEALPMARGRSGPFEVVHTIAILRKRLREADAVELVTVKPIVLGMAAWRTMLPHRRPHVTATFAGLGTVLDDALKTRFHPMTVVLRLLLRDHASVLVENADDARSLVSAGIAQQADIIVGPGVGLPASWLQHPANQPLEDDQPLTILYVGRLIGSKGVVDLIDALRVLKTRGTPVRALLAGSLDDRNPSAVSEAEVRQWEAEGLVEWLGHVSDLLPVYRRADIVVLPSHREGRPRSLMEAQALGIPVIATDVPGCRQVIAPNQTGLMVSPKNAVALADAIESLSSDRQTRSRYGANARKWAQIEFREEAFLDVWERTVLRTRKHH